LRWLRRLSPYLPVVVICHSEDARWQKEAMRLGAEEVLVRPVPDEQIECVISRILNSTSETIEPEIASNDIEAVGDDEPFLTMSPVMQKVREQAELLAQADVPVLILGEKGSGKCTVAHLIHKLSLRSGFDFQKVNCASMPGHLLEIALFGRATAMPANSGADRTTPAKLELSGKGTILLEEITEMPMNLQAKVFQWLQDKQFLGNEEAGSVDNHVRILATSSAKLDRALAERRLREDLYYRLNAFTVRVPPLRQRKEEIKVLLQCSMHRVARFYGFAPREFTPAVFDTCVSHSWPGNFPELETFVKRYLVAGETELMPRGQHTGSSDNGVHTLPPKLSQGLEEIEADTTPQSLKSLLEDVKSQAEKRAIKAALAKTGWNRKAAAQLLKVSYRSLLYKIERYHMTASQNDISLGTQTGVISEAKQEVCKAN
jgi:DNA-binding NtrC family response regulator